MTEEDTLFSSSSRFFCVCVSARVTLPCRASDAYPSMCRYCGAGGAQVRDECDCFEDDFLPHRVCGHQDMAAGGFAAGMLRLAGTVYGSVTLRQFSSPCPVLRRSAKRLPSERYSGMRSWTYLCFWGIDTIGT